MSKVLLVDDECFFLDAIGSTLKSEFSDVEVLEASDGKSAWNMYKKFKPDLVITDYVMPKWNGAELSKAIHEKDEMLPVILITGFADKVDTELFSDVLLKPFGIDELVKVARKHLQM
ncbi:MAG: response regulator [Oligoflexales bacterium]